MTRYLKFVTKTTTLPERFIRMTDLSISEKQGGGVYVLIGHDIDEKIGLQVVYKQAGSTGKPLKNGNTIIFSRDRYYDEVVKSHDWEYVELRRKIYGKDGSLLSEKRVK